MKISLFLGFLFLVGSLSVADATGSSLTGFSDELGKRSMPGEFSRSSFSAPRLDCASPENQRNQKNETQVSQRPDATMSASVLVDADAVLILLAVITLSQEDLFPLTPAPPQQTPFFEVLFNSIISPNAP